MPDASASSRELVRGRRARRSRSPHGQPGVDERREQLRRADRVALGARAGRARAARPRPAGGPRRCAAARARAATDGCSSRPASSSLGLGQPALADAQLGQRGDGRRAHLRDVARVGGERGLQRVLGLRPAPGGQQHVGVDRSGTRRTAARCSCVRANSSTSSHHSVAALPLAGARAGHDEVAVRLGERVDVAHAARRSPRPSPPRAAASPPRGGPALTSARPSRLSAKTSRSSAPASRAIVHRPPRVRDLLLDARRRGARARPRPSRGRRSRRRASSARSARASQPRAADARPPIRCWCDTQTATRAASSQRRART